jgi:hypothetical protein
MDLLSGDVSEKMLRTYLGNSWYKIRLFHFTIPLLFEHCDKEASIT